MLCYALHIGGTDLIEVEEDEVSSSLPDRRWMYRKASSESVPYNNAI